VSDLKLIEGDGVNLKLIEGGFAGDVGEAPADAAGADVAEVKRRHPSNAIGRNVIPRFEGEDVTAVRVKLTSASNLEFPRVLRTGEVMRLLVEARCVGVQHLEDPKTGTLVRTQVLKVVDAQPAPWDLDPSAFGDA
jgi:hypothetical protein